MEPGRQNEEVFRKFPEDMEEYLCAGQVFGTGRRKGCGFDVGPKAMREGSEREMDNDMSRYCCRMVE